LGIVLTQSFQKEELATIVPTKNSLSLVYRAGAKIMRFVKYVQHSAPYPLIDIAALYIEDPANKKDDNVEEKDGEEGGEEDDGETDEDDDHMDDEELYLHEPDRPTAIGSSDEDDGDE